MAILLSAKGSDITAWRAATDFSALFRQSLLNRLEHCGPDDAEQLLRQTISAIEGLAVANDAFCQKCAQQIADVSHCSEPAQLRELTTDFYSDTYTYFATHHSAPAFYQASSAFLQALAGAVRRYAENRMGALSRHIPRIGLIALGPAGRQEFSPFCPLQLMIVHGRPECPDAEAVSQFGHLIHEGFEASGLRVDSAITPRSPQWRGSMTEWHQRTLTTIERGKPQELIDLLRLADQSTLLGEDGLDDDFRLFSRSFLLESRPTLAMYVTRIIGISHGIGIMGGFRLVKSGPYRGKFAILENGLIPLTAAISAFALLKGDEAPSTPGRIRNGLARRELSVDLAERMLHSWHTLNELRLERELPVQPDWTNEGPLHLDIDLLNETERESLRSSLETAASAQRQVVLIFNEMETG